MGIEVLWPSVVALVDSSLGRIGSVISPDHASPTGSEGVSSEGDSSAGVSSEGVSSGVFSEDSSEIGSAWPSLSACTGNTVKVELRRIKVKNNFIRLFIEFPNTKTYLLVLL